MTTFFLILKCLPFLGFLGFGMYALCVALFPSWRDRGWTHWKISDGGPDDIHDPASWWVALGLVKPRKPLAEGDWDEKTAIWVYYCMAAVFLLIAVVGLVWVCLTYS